MIHPSAAFPASIAFHRLPPPPLPSPPLSTLACTQVLYSAIVKLAGIDTRKDKETDEAVTCVWRGVDESCLSLPEHFYRKTFDNKGMPGGAEKAFMSVTTDRDIAYRYAGGNSANGTIMEIEFDAASRGANVQFLSCAPREEWTLP